MRIVPLEITGISVTKQTREVMISSLAYRTERHASVTTLVSSSTARYQARDVDKVANLTEGH